MQDPADICCEVPKCDISPLSSTPGIPLPSGTPDINAPPTPLPSGTTVMPPLAGETWMGDMWVEISSFKILFCNVVHRLFIIMWIVMCNIIERIQNLPFNVSVL